MRASVKIALLLTVVIFSLPLRAQIVTTDTPNMELLITEVQTGSILSASEEFIELYNASDDSIDPGTFTLQYRSKSGDSWLSKATLDSAWQPRGYYLLTTSDYLPASSQQTGLGLAGSGGHLRLVLSDNEDPIDQVAWGTAEHAIFTPAEAPANGQSMKRKVDEDARYIDTDDDLSDFFVSDSPHPVSTPVPVVVNSAITNPDDQTDADDTMPVAAPSPQPPITTTQSFMTIEITELFPDPEKPQIDAEDEYIELFNPNSDAVELEGYILETGNSFSYSFVLPEIVLQPGQYLAVYSIDSGLALSNSGSTARIMAPDGTVLDEVAPYTNAKSGNAWALIAETWQWTDQPSPAEANRVAAAIDTLTGNKVRSSSENSNSKSSRGRVLSADSSDSERLIYEEPPALQGDDVDETVVASVGSLALLYAGYEYRYDIGNRFQQLKRYASRWRSRRKKP
jgi:hypothetical protein